MIRIRAAELGSHPEASALNRDFGDHVPLLKLRLEIGWEPEQARSSLAALETRLAESFPSLREHECRGREEYHILRSEKTDTELEAGLALAHLYEHVMIETIAFLTGARTVAGATGALTGSRTRFDIFVEAPDGIAGWLTAKLAVCWVTALLDGQALNGAPQKTLELSRYLYQAHPQSAELERIARDLGRGKSDIVGILDWLERCGLTRLVRYGMNFSGLCYYELSSRGDDPWAFDLMG